LLKETKFSTLFKHFWEFSLFTCEKLKSMKRITFFAILISLSVCGSLIAQESEDSHTESAESHENFQHHRLSVFTGYAFIGGAIDEDGQEGLEIIPLLGLDYDYWFHDKIAVGLKNDLELSEYKIELEDQVYLDRDYAFSTALVCIYEAIEGWAIFAGPGYEFEANEGFPLFKIGTDIGKSFEGGWGVDLTMAYDLKEENSSLSLGISVSKRLGK